MGIPAKVLLACLAEHSGFGNAEVVDLASWAMLHLWAGAERTREFVAPLLHMKAVEIFVELAISGTRSGISPFERVSEPLRTAGATNARLFLWWLGSSEARHAVL